MQDMLLVGIVTPTLLNSFIFDEQIRIEEVIWNKVSRYVSLLWPKMAYKLYKKEL